MVESPVLGYWYWLSGKDGKRVYFATKSGGYFSTSDEASQAGNAHANRITKLVGYKPNFGIRVVTKKNLTLKQQAENILGQESQFGIHWSPGKYESSPLTLKRMLQRHSPSWIDKQVLTGKLKNKLKKETRSWM